MTERLKATLIIGIFGAVVFEMVWLFLFLFASIITWSAPFVPMDIFQSITLWVCIIGLIIGGLIGFFSYQGQ